MNYTYLRRCYAIALGIFLSISVNAQVQTAKYITTNPRSNAFYEYLPQGYNPSGTQTYPLILFIHGMGELGAGTPATLPMVLRNGPPKLINQGVFPTSFTVNGVTHKYIVISPQFTEWPGNSDINTLLNYLIQNYKVDQSRIYMTGLSMGGGVVWEYAGGSAVYANRLAAIVPTCGASWPDQGRAHTMAAADLAVWATHNNGDPTAPVFYTVDYVNHMNNAPNPPTPLAKKTIFTSNSHDSWSQTYSLTFKEDNLNIYEWFLTHHRIIGNNPPPIVNAGPDKTITLPVNSVRYEATASDPGGSISLVYWTKVSGPAAGTIDNPTGLWTNMVNLVQGTYVFRLSVTDNGGAITTDDVTVTVNGSTTNQPPVANAGTDKNITLPVNSVTLTGSGSDPDGTVSSYLWAKISGPTSGTIVSPGTATTQLNGLTEGTYIYRLTVTDNGGLSSTDNVNVVVNGTVVPPPPPTGSRSVKVNLFGGSNPYSNNEWNNWNTNASLTSTSFLYNDQTSSTISSTLTSQAGIADNGASYASGATICPPQVLRYNSFSTTNRTLTIKGLNPSAQYGLQFFGSRANTGNKTQIQIGSQTSIINTDNNTTSYASFTAISPNSNGDIVVEISRIGTYNYLAGFIISEGTTGTPANQPPVVNAGTDGSITLPVNTVSLNGSATDADGSISTYAWTKVSGPVQGTITSPASASTNVTGLVAGNYTFRLTATDNGGAIASDDVSVTVSNATVNQPPVVNAGADQSITLPLNTITLTGSASDPDGTISSYNWTKISGPSTGTITSPAASTTSVSGLTEGTYTFRLTATDNSGGTSSDNVIVNVQPEPVSSGGRSVKVNIFGGSNPYTNSQWNNWNINAGLTSQNLMFDDQATSTIKANISAQAGVADNGASYASGATIVPPAVLRYNSYNTSNRTLTITGLNPAITYTMQFFGSRANTGNKTVVQIGSVSDTINTDNNSTDYANLTNISPDNTGKVTIELWRIGTYNYLAGFIITEQTTTRAIMQQPISNSSNITNETGDPEVKYLYDVQTYPNPAQSRLNVTVISPVLNQQVIMILTDVQGRIVFQKQALMAQKTQNESIDMSAMINGIYVLTIQIAGKKMSRQVIKN